MRSTELGLLLLTSCGSGITSEPASPLDVTGQGHRGVQLTRCYDFSTDPTQNLEIVEFETGLRTAVIEPDKMLELVFWETDSACLKELEKSEQDGTLSSMEKCVLNAYREFPDNHLYASYALEEGLGTADLGTMSLLAVEREFSLNLSAHFDGSDGGLTLVQLRTLAQFEYQAKHDPNSKYPIRINQRDLEDLEQAREKIAQIRESKE